MTRDRKLDKIESVVVIFSETASSPTGILVSVATRTGVPFESLVPFQTFRFGYFTVVCGTTESRLRLRCVSTRDICVSKYLEFTETTKTFTMRIAHCLKYFLLPRPERPTGGTGEDSEDPGVSVTPGPRTSPFNLSPHGTVHPSLSDIRSRGPK